MRKYVVRRLLILVPTVFLMATGLFFMMYVMPGDVALTMLISEEMAADPKELARLRKDLGLDAPVVVRYGRWLWNTVRGDLGYSHYFRREVHEGLVAKMELTVGLAILAVVVAVAWSIPLGIASAVFRGSWLDQLIRVLSTVNMSMPNFWLGILILLLLVRQLHWIPPILHVRFFEDPVDFITRLVIPSAVIGIAAAGSLTRMTRSMMLEVLGEDYVRTARAKGLHAVQVMVRHALPNALLPVVTMASLLFVGLVDGAVIMERVFNLPGMGQYLITAVEARDATMVLGLVLLIGLFVLLWNLATDLVYGRLDPRIRYD